MYEIDAFCAALEGVSHSVDPTEVRAKSRDYFAVSPLLRQALAGKTADVVVAPATKAEVLTTIRAAVRLRIPITARGGGTANYGQSVPLNGGILLDMTKLSGVLWTKPGAVRVYAGTLMSQIDAVTRPQGWELRLHPSTRATATIGGFVAGGSGGMGSCQWGMLRDRGNITAVEVISAEEEPRTLELRGRDVELVHHAYGANCIITEIEMPAAPAWAWREAIVAFPDYMRAARFALDLAQETGIIKKVISVQEWPVPRLMRDLGPVVPDGHTMVNCMIAEPCLQAFSDLVGDFGGTVVSDHAEGQGPYGAPLYEFTYGHGLKQIQKYHPKYTGLQGMFGGTDVAGMIGRVRTLQKGEKPMRLEVFWNQGEVVAMGSPAIVYESEQQMSDMVRMMQAEGVNVANSHTTGVKAVGIKSIDARDATFKASMDPYGLLNPGKMDFGDTTSVVVTSALPTSGWKRRSETAA
jgi:hypothetical protein